MCIVFLLNAALISRDTNVQKDIDYLKWNIFLNINSAKYLPALSLLLPHVSSLRCRTHPNVGGRRGNIFKLVYYF